MSSSPPPPSSSPLLSRYLPAVSLILAAFGVPTVIIVAFTHFVTTYPWLALIIAVLYETGILIVSIVGQVWHKLQLRWVDRLTDWADSHIQGVASRYRRQYCRYLSYQHRDFDVKGLSTQGIYALELNQVFVELNIDPKPMHEASSNPLNVPQELCEGGHSIWDYLASAPLINQHLVILGPPGSGKTTLLKHMALCLVAHRRPWHRHEYPRTPYKLPIVLFLRDHVDALKEGGSYSLVDALHDHLKKWEQPLPPPNWVKNQLTSGRCLVMLDGLDEVAESQVRQEAVNWVQRQMVAYPRNRFIITSRPFGYRSHPLSGVTILEVRSFTPQQVERFVHNWYLANEIMSKQKDDPGVHMRAKAGAKDLLQRLRNIPTLYALAVNPLLLTMITTVHRFRGSLPGKRIALYAEIFEVFLGKRQEARGQTLELLPAQMQLVLQPLAYHLMRKGERDISLDEAQTVIAQSLAYVSAQLSPKAFLQLVEHTSGLLLERESGIYSFAHLTFQEYLAAAHIHSEALEQTLVTQVRTTWWHETIRLYCAQGDATLIIFACLAGGRPSVQTLALAIECQQEALKIQPVVNAQLDALLKQGAEDSDPERQHVVAKALLVQRLRRMIQMNEEIYVDTSLITCAEYQVFLDEQLARGEYYQPDHWVGTHYPADQAHSPVLGVRLSDAKEFCTWLTEWEKGLWQYRLPQRGEPVQKVDDEGRDGLRAGAGYWLNEGFAWAKQAPFLQEGFLQNFINTTLALDLARSLDYHLTQAFAYILDLAHVLDLDFALTRDHVRALDLNLDHASNLASNLAHALDLAGVLDLDLDLTSTRDFDFMRTLIRSRNRARARILTLALDLAHSLDLALDLVHSLDLPHNPTRGRGRIREIEIEIEIDLALIFALISALARNLELAPDLAHSLDLAYERAHVRGLARALDLNLALTNTLHRIHALNLDCALDSAFYRTNTRDFDLARALDSAFYRTNTRDLDLTRSNIIVYVFSLYMNRLPSVQRTWIERLFRHLRGTSQVEQPEKLKQQDINRFLDIYINLVVLKARRTGKLPAFEGILLIKERKQNI